MELIDQHTKKIMEGCKERARDAGLTFSDESLEYIVTNRDLLELSPKIMIPTLYDYWVHDVEVLKEKGKYELYPGNPYETVINTRPPISFYNDNNPDWLNVMIFYHVLGHIDFFQNNLYFKKTWDYDFTGQALSDKRLIAKLRSEKGRWVDYIIEFSRGIDNIVGYFDTFHPTSQNNSATGNAVIDYYFDVFLQSAIKTSVSDYIKEIERYNATQAEQPEFFQESFLEAVKNKYPEFDALYKKFKDSKSNTKMDLLQYLMEHSEFLNKESNLWMKSILEVVRNTSLFFQPQIRTKIMNEGWASYWHETLFMTDERISGHEVDFARVNAGVTSMPRVGLNPYALGLRLFNSLYDMAEKGKYSMDFKRLTDAETRKHFDHKKGQGKEFIFSIRENFCDFMFINTFVDQDFVSDHKLFVAGKRLNRSRMVWEYYVKSRKAEHYRQMILNSLYHPPHIRIIDDKKKDDSLYLYHEFEGKPLVTEFIANTLMGIEYLWGGPVHIETSDAIVTGGATPAKTSAYLPPSGNKNAPRKIKWQRVVYTMKNRKLSRKFI